MMNDSNNEKKSWQIEYYQAFALITAISFGSIIPLSGIGQELGRNIWQAVVISLVLGIVFCLFLNHLSNRYSGKSLIEMNRQVFGNNLAKLINLIFFIQFFFSFSFILNSAITFWEVYGREEYSYWLFVLIVIGISLLAATFGIEAIGRITIIFIISLLIIFFFDLFLVLPQIKINRLLPLGLEYLDINSLFQNGFKFFILQFSLYPMALMITVYMKKGKKLGKGIIIAFFLSGFYVFFNIIRNCLLLGDTINLYQYPILQALKMVEWGPIFSRLEMLGIIVIIANALIYLAINCFLICMLAKEILSMKYYQSFFIPFILLEVTFLYFTKKFINIFTLDFWLSSLTILFFIVLSLLLIAVFYSYFRIFLKLAKKEEKSY